MSETILVEHFTNEQEWSLKSVDLSLHRYWIKPDGALYTSPVASIFGWRHWTRDEVFGLGSYRIELEVEVNRCYQIDSVRDMHRLPWRKHPQTNVLEYVDYQHMLRQGVQCVWLTVDGQWATRSLWPRNLNGWDCETIAILDTACILDWRLDRAYQRTGISQVAQTEPRLAPA